MDDRVSKKGSFKIYQRIKDTDNNIDFPITMFFHEVLLFSFFFPAEKSEFVYIFAVLPNMKSATISPKVPKKCGNKSPYFSQIRIFFLLLLPKYLTCNCLYSLFLFFYNLIRHCTRRACSQIS